MADSKSLASVMKAEAAKDKKRETAENEAALKGANLPAGFDRVRLAREFLDKFGVLHQAGVRDLPKGGYPKSAAVLVKGPETDADEEE